MQATAYLKRNLFHEWQFVGRAVSAAEPRALSFGLNLGTFVECLRILGGRDGGRGDALDKPATLRLEYRSSTAAFQLTLVEGAAVTECRLRTLETEDDETLVMDEEVAAKVVLKSDSLRVRRARSNRRPRAPRARPYRASAPVAVAPHRLTIACGRRQEGIGELEWGGDNASHRSKRMTLRVALSPPQLSFTVSSVDLGCEMVYPVDALLRFDAAGGVEFDYRFALLSTALRSLRDSEETQMRIGRNGLLEILLKFSCAPPPTRPRRAPAAPNPRSRAPLPRQATARASLWTCASCRSWTRTRTTSSTTGV